MGMGEGEEDGGRGGQAWNWVGGDGGAGDAQGLVLQSSVSSNPSLQLEHQNQH